MRQIFGAIAKETRRTTLAVLRSIFEIASEWGYFAGRNPCKKTKVGETSGRVWDKRALEPAEALRLFRAIDADQPLAIIVEVALFTGLRASEVLALTWGAIDPRRSLVRVKQGKSQQGEFSEPKTPKGRRQVDLGPLASKLIRPESARDSDLIWPDEDYFCLQKKLKDRAKDIGIEFVGFGFHTLRRTHATWRDDVGLSSKPDESLVRDMGHANASMTEHYIQRPRTGVVEKLQNLVYFSGDSRESGNVN
jgi:integrase